MFVPLRLAAMPHSAGDGTDVRSHSSQQAKTLSAQGPSVPLSRDTVRAQENVTL